MSFGSSRDEVMFRDAPSLLNRNEGLQHFFPDNPSASALWNAICKIRVKTDIKRPDGTVGPACFNGTGFLCEFNGTFKGLMTCYHVMTGGADRWAPADEWNLTFKMELDTSSNRRDKFQYGINPQTDVLWIYYQAFILDFIFIAFSDTLLSCLEKSKKAFYFLPITTTSFSTIPTALLLQCQQSQPFQSAIGEVISFAGSRIDYRINTEASSSGSPVFHKNGSLIAMHRAGKPDTSEESHNGRNFGTPMKYIYKEITKFYYSFLQGKQTQDMFSAAAGFIKTQRQLNEEEEALIMENNFKKISFPGSTINNLYGIRTNHVSNSNLIDLNNVVIEASGSRTINEPFVEYPSSSIDEIDALKFLVYPTNQCWYYTTADLSFLYQPDLKPEKKCYIISSFLWTMVENLSQALPRSNDNEVNK